MNVRQQAYKKNRISGMNAYRSAIAAGYSHNTAIHAYKNIEKRLNFQDVLIKAGLDDQTITKVMNDGLNANRVVSAVITGKDAGAADHDFIEVPDYSVRHKYLETLLKLNGKLNEKIDISAQLKIVEMRTIEIIKGNERIPLEFRIG